MFKTKLIRFYDAYNDVAFYYSENDIVYIIKNLSDYDLKTEDAANERMLDEIDAIKEIGRGRDRGLLVATLVENVKIGQTIYDQDGKHEGYRSE